MIKQFFPVLLALCTLFTPAHAEDNLTLSTSLADSGTPFTFTNAHNVQLSLIPEAELKNGGLWRRLRSGFTLQEMDSPLIAKHEQWYASHPEYLARMMDRASRYLYYITSEVERRGMPSEIALLPMIESAFNPGAYSTSHASGLWQFIPSTGRNFGLRQNWWYDGRRDVVGATTGALDYLEKLHDMFGDWELALAAYNWGEGSVQRAQERNRRLGLPIDYTSLKLPDETRNYLPKLLAIKNIVADPTKFGLSFSDIPNEPYFAAVTTTKHIDVKLAAQLADISKEEFIALNPARNRPVILQDNNDTILLPVDKIETYQTNLENYDKPLVSWQPYYAKRGERLDRLAPRFGLSVKKLKSVNSLSSGNRLRGGETLLVPVIGDTTSDETEFEAFNMHLHPMRTSSGAHYAPSIKHIVKHGETLAHLANRYKVSTNQLKRWNGQSGQFRTGQEITIVQVNHGTSQVSHSHKSHLARSRSIKLAQSKSSHKHTSSGGRLHLAFQNK